MLQTITLLSVSFVTLKTRPGKNRVTTQLTFHKEIFHYPLLRQAEYLEMKNQIKSFAKPAIFPMAESMNGSWYFPLKTPLPVLFCAKSAIPQNRGFLRTLPSTGFPTPSIYRQEMSPLFPNNGQRENLSFSVREVNWCAEPVINHMMQPPTTPFLSTITKKTLYAFNATQNILPWLDPLTIYGYLIHRK